MQEVLREKSVMVIDSLVNTLSSKNRDDYHMTLNASQVLNEFRENETFFQLLTEPENLKKIVDVCNSTDDNKMNIMPVRVLGRASSMISLT